MTAGIMSHNLRGEALNKESAVQFSGSPNCNNSIEAREAREAREAKKPETEGMSRPLAGRRGPEEGKRLEMGSERNLEN
jgi:hypothetical protein